MVSAFTSCVDSKTNNIYSPVMIPDWTNVTYEPFNLSVPEGITNRVLTASIVTDRSKARPGGRPIVFDANRIIRFRQKCDRVYGEMARAFEVDTLTETSYIEHELPESPVIKKSGSGWNSNSMHNFDPWWTGSRWVCAVDGYDGNSWSIGIYVTESFRKPGPVKSASLCYNAYPRLLLHWLMI